MPEQPPSSGLSEIQDYKAYALSSAWEERLPSLGFILTQVTVRFYEFNWLEQRIRIQVLPLITLPDCVLFRIFRVNTGFDNLVHLGEKTCPIRMAFAFARNLIALDCDIFTCTVTVPFIYRIESAMASAFKQAELDAFLEQPKFASLRP